MLKNCLKRDVAFLLGRPEFYFSLFISVVVAVTGFGEAILSCRSMMIDILSTAAHKAMIFKGGIGQAMSACLLLIIACIPFSDSYLQEKHLKIQALYETRCSTQVYITSKAIVVFFSGFIISILPYILNQILCLIAFPLKGSISSLNLDIYSNMLWTEQSNSAYKTLFMNAPYLNNFLHILHNGIFGASVALLAFTITLYFRKNRLLNMCFPLFIYLFFLILLQSEARNFVPFYYLFANPVIANRDLTRFIYTEILCIVVPVIMIIIYVFMQRKKFFNDKINLK